MTEELQGPFRDLWSEYKIYVSVERRLSQPTVLSYAAGSRDYLAYLTTVRGLSAPADITREDIRSYLTHLHKTGVSPATEAHVLTIITSFHRFLVLEHKTENDASLGLHRPKQARRLPVVLSASEIDRLLAVIGDETPEDWRDRAMVELCFYSGLRVSELVGLSLSDLHFNTGLVTLHGKGAKERIVPLSATSMQSLSDYLAKARPLLAASTTSDAVFLSRKTHQALDRQSFNVILKKKAALAGINKPVSPHKLRHTYATELLENGMDIRLIQELLGHESVATTEIYTHVGNERLKETYLAAFPRAQETPGKKTPGPKGEPDHD